MRAAVMRDWQLRVDEVPDPVPGAGQVLTKVLACGICGSDVHGFDGSTGRRIPPIVMGHEASGVVTEVGANVKGFKPGDRVALVLPQRFETAAAYIGILQMGVECLYDFI